MADYPLQDVHIEGNYPVEELLYVEASTGANRHGYFIYQGICSKETAEKTMHQSSRNDTVTISFGNEIEFVGHLEEVDVIEGNEHYRLHVKLSTQSRLADTTLQKRFFQDTSLSYGDILCEVYDDSGDGTDLIGIRGEREIKAPLFQYGETDWEFTLRIAGILGTVVIPNNRIETPQFALGVPKSPAIEETDPIVFRHRKINLARPSPRSQTAQLAQSVSFALLGSRNYYHLGDTVIYDSNTLVVMEKHVKTESSVARLEYILGTEEGYQMQPHSNIRITGLELDGTIVKSYGETVQVALDIDKNRKTKKYTSIGYATVTNNGMYSVPNEGERISLQWQSESDSDILAVHCCRESELPSPSEHYLATEHDNQMCLLPEELSFLSPKNKLQLLATSGIKLTSEASFHASAGQDINILANGHVYFGALKEALLAKSGNIGTINMHSQEIHIISKNTRIHSRSETPEPDMPPISSISITAAAAAKLSAAIPIRGKIDL